MVAAIGHARDRGGSGGANWQFSGIAPRVLRPPFDARGPVLGASLAHGIDSEDPVLDLACSALASGAWEEAKALFDASLREQITPRALEGLGYAALWLEDAETMFQARLQAYRLYRDLGDDLSAARVAIWLAWSYHALRGESTLASGWLQRAHRLLEGVPQAAEHGWLLLRDAAMALTYEKAPAKARDLAAAACQVGRQVGCSDVEMLAFALEGLALVSLGNTREGMRLLDEATAAILAGEMRDIHAVAFTSCYLLYACELIRDYERAGKWGEKLQELSVRHGTRPLFSVCRVQYAAVLIWHGKWVEAERELITAVSELKPTGPAFTVLAAARLAEIRRRQGQLGEAERLLAQVHSHALACLGLAEIALAQGQPRIAEYHLDRYLRTLSVDDRMGRAAALEVLVRVQIASDTADAARSTVVELNKLAEEAGTPAIRAAASYAEGLVQSCGSDHGAAVAALERAIDLYAECNAPYELARARRELARCLVRGGLTDAARLMAQGAADLFEQVGAIGELDVTRSLLQSLEECSKPSQIGGPFPLSKREEQVLRLIGTGMTNPKIAEYLFLSEHTIHRHVANILNKLGLRSRVAAAAFAAKHHLV